MVNPFNQNAGDDDKSPKRLDAFARHLVINAALCMLSDWTPYSKIAVIAGGLANTTLNPTKVKEYLETLCHPDIGVVIHKKGQRYNQMMRTQLYKANDPIGLRREVEIALDSHFAKATCLNIEDIKVKLDKGITVLG